MKKILRIILFTFLAVILIFAGYLLIGKTGPAQEITFGVNFSQKQAELLGFDWETVYSALLEDLGVKNIKLATYWDLLERQEGAYDFKDLDLQIKQAEEKEVKMLLVIGMKTPRWPECHVPQWANGFGKEKQQAKILDLLRTVVLRYRNSQALWAWQIENEPFFPFGECPWVDKNFLKNEINLVKSLDTQHPVVISDSGEGSFWWTAAKLGDVAGTTLYKKVWVRQLGIYLTYPFPPVFYHRKAEIVRRLFGKEVICVELQSEPWGPKLLYDSPPEEQAKTMNLEQFRYNLEFARNTGLKKFYLWGAEWWYWLKAKQDNPEIWDEAKKLF